MQQQLTNQKLRGLPVTALRELADEVGVERRGSHGRIAARLLDQPSAVIDEFLRRKYREKVADRQQQIITNEELLAELHRIESTEWGVVQGQLDGKIQREYTRRFARYDDLILNAQSRLHPEIANWRLRGWYNHWSTVLIEDHINQHRNVVPTIKSIKGIDLFFRGHPFDLKITYLPQNYDLGEALANPRGLARWLYENQEAKRFGADNRLYVVVVDTDKVQESWRLKRNFALLSRRIDQFLDESAVNGEDSLSFVFQGQLYVPTCKILIVTQEA